MVGRRHMTNKEMAMEKIKEEITGGEVAEKDWNMLSTGLIRFGTKKGDVSAVKKVTTYRTELLVPYTIALTEIVTPAKYADGEQDEIPSSPEIKIDLKFPYSIGQMEGQIELYVYAKDVEHVNDSVLKAIGNALAMAEMKDTVVRDRQS